MDKLKEACVMLGSDGSFALAPLLEVVSTVMGKPYKFHIDGNKDYQFVITTIANRVYKYNKCEPFEDIFTETYTGDITFTYDQKSALFLQSVIRKVRKDFKKIKMVHKQLYLCYCFPFCVKWMHRLFATYNCLKVSYMGEKMTQAEIKEMIDLFYKPVYKTLDHITAKIYRKHGDLKAKYHDIFEYGLAIMYLDRIGAINLMSNLIRTKYIRLPQHLKDKLAKMKAEFKILFSTSLYIYKPDFISKEDIALLSFKTDQMGRPYAKQVKMAWMVRCLEE